MNTWHKPEVTTISMNAEVGAYQEDFDGERPDGEVRVSRGSAASSTGRSVRREPRERANAIARSERLR
jgi:hypothetical protein